MMNSIFPLLFPALPWHLHSHFQSLQKQLASLQTSVLINTRTGQMCSRTGRDHIIEMDIKAFYVDVLTYHLLTIQSCLILFQSHFGVCQEHAGTLFTSHLVLIPWQESEKSLEGVRLTVAITREFRPWFCVWCPKGLCSPKHWFRQHPGSVPEWGPVVTAPFLSPSCSLTFLTCRLHEWWAKFRTVTELWSEQVSQILFPGLWNHGIKTRHHDSVSKKTTDRILKSQTNVETGFTWSPSPA